MNEVKRAAGYIRVSTAEQSLKGLSIETQIAEIKAYAESHNMKLVGTYVDRGITARKSLDKRLEFMKMMKDVQSGEINHIIVLRLDRFFRNVYDYHRMMNEYLNPNNCDWSAVKEQYTTTTTNGRLMINLRLAIAEQECDTDSDRIKDVIEHRARQGYVVTGSVQPGLKIVDKRIVRDEETNHIIQDLFNQVELLSSVRKSMFHINAKYGTKFTYGMVRRMLSNPYYCGRYRDIENYCEPTVTKEQFDRVQELLKKNVRDCSTIYFYVFSGLLKCGCCGNKLVGHAVKYREKVHIYYRCNKHAQNHLCDNNLQVKEGDLVKYLFENIEPIAEKMKKEIELKAQKNKAKKSNRKNIEKKLQRLNEIYVDGFIEKEKYEADYAKLKSQIIDDPEEEMPDFSRIKEFLENYDEEKYATMTDVERQAMWRGVIDHVRMVGNDVTGLKFVKKFCTNF